MPLLEGTLKHYEWGSKTSIPELRGIPPSGEPEAELWFGSDSDGLSRPPQASPSDSPESRVSVSLVSVTLYSLNFYCFKDIISFFMLGL